MDDQPANPHDWESEIVGYRDQSEPKWATEFGYRPPIRKYRCKNCGETFTAEGGYAIFILTTDVECPGRTTADKPATDHDCPHGKKDEP